MKKQIMICLVLATLYSFLSSCSSSSSGNVVSGEEMETVSLLLPSHLEYGEYSGDDFVTSESVDISVEFNDDTVKMNLSMYEHDTASGSDEKSSVMTRTIVTDYSGNIQSTSTVINQDPFDSISIADTHDYVTDDRGNTIAQISRTDSTGTDEIIESKITQYYSDESIYRLTTFNGDIDENWDTSNAWTEMITYRSYNEDGNVLEKVIESPVSVTMHYYTYEDDNIIIDEVYTGEEETPEVMYKISCGDGLLQEDYMLKCTYAWDSDNNEWSEQCECDSWYYNYKETGGVKRCIRETYNRYNDSEMDGTTLIEWQTYDAPVEAAFLIDMDLDDLKHLFMLADEG